MRLQCLRLAAREQGSRFATSANFRGVFVASFIFLAHANGCHFVSFDDKQVELAGERRRTYKSSTRNLSCVLSN